MFKTKQKNRIIKGFTLIELLIVVAIIGILAGVGIPMYNGYMEEAKIKASKSNHVQVVSFISSELVKCNLGSTKIISNLVKCSERFTNYRISTPAESYFEIQNGQMGFRNPYKSDNLGQLNAVTAGSLGFWCSDGIKGQTKIENKNSQFQVQTCTSGSGSVLTTKFSIE
jgi:prepilin-type N-terminal cleavage/methylation domain-containing protein